MPPVGIGDCLDRIVQFADPHRTASALVRRSLLRRRQRDAGKDKGHLVVPVDARIEEPDEPLLQLLGIALHAIHFMPVDHIQIVLRNARTDNRGTP